MVVEDELLIADMVASTLEKAGYNVCGIARTISEAVTLVKLYSPNLAVIDLRLEDGELGPASLRNWRGPAPWAFSIRAATPPGFC